MRFGLGDGTIVPTNYVAPLTGPQAPAGYWVNPSNSTQWLPQTDAAKIGGLCFQGPSIGQWAVGGNYSNSVLYCGNLPCQKAVLICGAIGAVAFLVLPGGWRLVAAAVAALGITSSCLFQGGM